MRDPNLTTAIADMPAIPRIGSGYLLGGWRVTDIKSMQTNVTCGESECPLDFADSEKNGASDGKTTECQKCGRKLKWREVIYGRALLGTLNQSNIDYNIFPTTTYVLSKPYFEAGFGIENILKFVRIDFVWRLNYLDHPDIRRFGVMG